MNEEQLRAALRDEAEAVAPGAESLDRIHQRLARPSPTPIRIALVPAVAVVVLVALVVGGVVVTRERADVHGASSRPAEYPRRVLAVTDTGHPVVLSSRTGRRLSGYDASGYASGTQLAVAADARNFYWVEGAGNKGCQAHSIVRLPLVGGRPGTQIADEASEPAISPDGRYLAYYRCLPGDERADELVLRELATGSERVWSAASPDFFGERLVFEADSRHLIIEMNRDRVGSAGGHRRLNRLSRLAVEQGSPLPGAEFGVAPFAFLGRLGPSGDYLGRFPRLGRDSVVGMRPSDAENRRVFSAGPRFSVPHRVQWAVSDATGDHVLVVARRTLYRWSRGDRHPIKVRDGIIAAAWIPNVKPASAPPPAIVAAKTADAVRPPGPLVVLDAATGAELRRINGPVDPVMGVASSPDGSEVVFGTRPTGGSVCDGTMQGVEILNGLVRPILGEGADPVVNRSGLAAYGYRCDGAGLGFTNVNTGENYRSHALGGRRSESSPKIEEVEALAWSPDGTRLLYRLKLHGDVTQHYYVGLLWPTVPSRRTKVIEVPDAGDIAAATFIDNDRLVLAEAGARGTELRTWRIGRHATLGVGTLPRGVTSLFADGSGLHILAIADGRLLWWNRGDPGFHLVTDHVTAAAWLGSR